VVARELSFAVTRAETGERVDKILARRLKLGRRATAELFASGKVRVDGRKVPKGFVVSAGQNVAANAICSSEATPEPDAPLNVRYVDDQVVVVDKPAGQPTAVVHAGDTGTLANALVGRYPEMADVGYSRREPGLVHRLDTGTSGLLVAARTQDAFMLLRDGLKRGALEKHYLAIVPAGLLPERGSFASWLATNPRDRRRVAVAHTPERLTGAQHRATHWRVLGSNGPWQLLRLFVSSAYRHQIRAHLAAMGFPIAGDVLYGGRVDSRLGHRHALHASYIAWAGEGTVGAFAVCADLPREMEDLLDPS
jgi:23S rRNA pseudouridine1911/1915/1917 synthase